MNDRTILTSSYCTAQTEYKFLFYASAGSNDIIELFNKKRYEIESYIIHPNLTFHWKKKHQPINDIALIKLSNPIEFSETVQPACFDLKNIEEYTDGNLTTIGHGYDKVIKSTYREIENVNKTRYLKEINLLDVSSTDKENCWYDANICVVGKNGIESPCFWDNGNPLQITKSDGKTSVIGTASSPSLKFVDEQNVIACLGTESSIYTRIAKYWNWIKTHIDDDYCESD